MTAVKKSTLSVRIVSIIVAIVALACVAMLAGPAQQAQAAPKAKVTVKKASGAVTQLKIKTSGAPKGTISYKLYAKGKTFSGKNGKLIGKKADQGRAISVKVGGKLAKQYNVYYRAFAKGYGWLGWAKNGAKAGTAELALVKCQVKLVKKTAAQPDTARKAFSPKGGFATKITGDKKTDKAIKKAAKANSMDLVKCLTWASSNIQYSGSTRPELTATSEYSKARLKTEAKAAFVEKMGNCYTYTAAGYCLATHLGYSPKLVVGTYTSAKTGKVQVYSWFTLNEGGQENIYDVTNNRFPLTSADEAYALFAAAA